VSRNLKLVVAVVAVFAVGFAYWSQVLGPKREEAARLDKEVAAQETTLQEAQAQLAAYERARKSYRRNYAVVTRLGKAVPADDDVRSLMYQIDATARRSSVDFRTIDVGGDGATPAEQEAKPGAPAAAAPPPGTVSVGSAGFSAMPFTFTFQGSFFRLSDFFRRLERYVKVSNDRIDVTGRLLLVGSLAIDTTGGLDDLKAQVGAASYLVPPAQGITAGATPQAPAGVKPGAPSSPGGTTPPATTATITGVR
jgi:hypothetical protein